MQFGQLSKIEIGGTKGKVLAASVQQIHSDFTQAVNRVRSMATIACWTPK